MGCTLSAKSRHRTGKPNSTKKGYRYVERSGKALGQTSQTESDRLRSSRANAKSGNR